MYCKNCKFYKYERTDEIIDEKIDGSEVIKKIKRGTCSNKNIRYAWELENDYQLIYHDSEDCYKAFLYVGELFGCVHFKEVEKS